MNKLPKKELERLRKLYKKKPLKVRSDCCKAEMIIVFIKNVHYNKCAKCRKLCNWIGDEEFEKNIEKELTEVLKSMEEV